MKLFLMGLSYFGRFLAYGLNPRLGRMIKPVKQSYFFFGRVFIGVFAAMGLFERSHPWVREGVRVKPLNVLTLAWVKTDWRKPWRPIPVTVLSITIMAASGLLAMSSGMLSIGTRATQAYADSYFSSPTPDTDIALRYLGAAVGMQINDPGGSTLATSISPMVEGFQQMMALYSTVMLVIAGFVLMYIIIAAVAGTAHEGRFGGGSFNHIWAPIRLIVAIGLLVPLPTGSYSGYNSGQYIVVTMAQWGSGFASHLWVPFATSLADKGNILAEPAVGNAAVTVETALIAEFCKSRYNNILHALSAGTTNPPTDPAIDRIVPPNPVGTKYSIYYTAANNASSQYCGRTEYEITNNATPFVKAMLDEYQLAYFNMLDDVEALANELNVNPDLIDFQGGAQPDVGKEDAIWTALTQGYGGVKGYVQIVEEYQAALKTAVTNAKESQTDSARDAMVSDIENAGWAGAAMWFNTISRLNAEFLQSARAIPVTFSPDYVLDGDANTPSTLRLAQNVKYGVNSLIDRLNGIAPQLSTAYANYSGTTGTAAGAGSVLAGTSGGVKNSANYNADVSHFMSFVPDLAGSMVQKGLTDIFSTFVGGPFQNMWLGTNTHLDEVYPLAQLAQIGDWLVERSFALFGFSLIPGLSSLFIFALMGAGAGIMLQYVLPLIPFIRFLFAFCAWLLVILEAIIAVPLVALAHLTTKGEGVSGDMARSAYFMIFSIFFRPAFLVIGMIVALMMFSVMVGVLNDMYRYAVLGFQGASGGNANGGFATIMYTILYVVIAYMMCNLCFKMIEEIPDHAFKWINQASAGREVTADEKVHSIMANAGDQIVWSPMRSVQPRATKIIGD